MKEIIKTLLFRIDLIRTATALVVLAIFAFITWSLVHSTIPEGNKEIVHNLVGIIEGTVMTIVGYEFGSSKGTQPKTDKGDTIEASKTEQPKL